LFVCVSFYMFIRPSVRLYICPSLHLSVQPTLCLSACLSVFLSTWNAIVNVFLKRLDRFLMGSLAYPIGVQTGRIIKKDLK
jgi:hypothetical protein